MQNPELLVGGVHHLQIKWGGGGGGIIIIILMAAFNISTPCRSLITVT